MTEVLQWWGSPLVPEEKYTETPVKREEMVIIIKQYIILARLQFILSPSAPTSDTLICELHYIALFGCEFILNMTFTL